ncbi:putative enoyl-CoA hydratase [Hyaloraphidium curvatum]|nr:putative enoyl-CoA hydratase [Hyaloraphidium curvatum]
MSEYKYSAKHTYDLLKVTMDKGVATVEIVNPPMNIVTWEMYMEWADLIPKLATDPDVRAVVLRSRQKGFFMAHFDVDYLAHKWKPMRAGELAPDSWRLFAYHEMAEILRTMPKPTIAMINGRAGGGGSELALSCDMRFAGPDAMFNQMEVALGILPGGSGTVRLPRLCGRSRAMEIILSSDDFSAELAEQYGWVNRTFKTEEELEAHVYRLAERIAKFEPNAVARAKQCVLRAEKGVVEDLIAESQDFSELMKVDNWPENLRMKKYVSKEIGGQTVEGESKVGETVGLL